MAYQAFHSDARLLAFYRTLFRVNRNDDEEVIKKRAEEFDYLSVLSILNDTELALFTRQFGMFTGVSEPVGKISQDLHIPRHNVHDLRQAAWVKMREFAAVPKPTVAWTDPSSLY